MEISLEEYLKYSTAKILEENLELFTEFKRVHSGSTSDLFCFLRSFVLYVKTSHTKVKVASHYSQVLIDKLDQLISYSLSDLTPEAYEITISSLKILILHAQKKYTPIMDILLRIHVLHLKKIPYYKPEFDIITNLVIVSKYERQFNNLTEYLHSEYNNLAQGYRISIFHSNAGFFQESLKILKKVRVYKESEMLRFLSLNLDSIKKGIMYYKVLVCQLVSIEEFLSLMKRVFSFLMKFVKNKDFLKKCSDFTKSLLVEFDDINALHSEILLIILSSISKNHERINLAEFCADDLLFSKPLLSRLSSEPHKEKWLVIWNAFLAKTNEIDLCSKIISFAFHYKEISYIEGFTIFLIICKKSYQNILLHLVRLGIIDSIFKELIITDLSEYSEFLLKCLSAIFNDNIDLKLQHNLLELLLHKSISSNENIRARLRYLYLLVLNKAADQDLNNFLIFFKCLKEPGIYQFIVDLIIDIDSSKCKSYFLKNNIEMVLIYEFIKVDGFSIYVKIRILMLLFQLRKYKYNISLETTNLIIEELRRLSVPDRRCVLDSLIEDLVHLFTEDAPEYCFYLLSLELVTFYFEDNERILLARDLILGKFKLKEIGYQNVDSIANTIINNYLHIPPNYIGPYNKCLLRCLKYNIKPENILQLLNYFPYKCKGLLTLLNSCLSNTNKYPVFWQLAKYSSPCPINLNFIFKGGLTLVFVVHPKNQLTEAILFEISDGDYKISVKLCNGIFQIRLVSPKFCIEECATQKILPKQWNVLAVSLRHKKGLTVSFLVNGIFECRERFEGQKLKGKMKFMCCGNGINNNLKFEGKIGAVVVIKRFINEDQLKIFSEKLYFNESEIANELKGDILYLLAQPNMTPYIANSKGEKSSALIYFEGKGIKKRLKYCTTYLYELLKQQHDDETIITLIEIFTSIFKIKEFDKYIDEGFVDLLTSKLNSIDKLHPINSKYLDMIINISQLKLKKRAFKCYLINPHLKSIKTYEWVPNFLKEFNRLFKFNQMNFFLLIGLTRNMTSSNISFFFQDFSKQFSNCKMSAEVISGLIAGKELALIHGLLKIIEVSELNEDAEAFFEILLHLFNFPIFFNDGSVIFNVIFGYYFKSESTRLSKSDELIEIRSKETKSPPQDLYKILLLLQNIEFNSECLLDSLNSFAKACKIPREKSTREFLFNLILSKFSALEAKSINKFIEYLGYNKEFLPSCLLNSKHFPQFLIDLSNTQESKAGEILLYIYSQVQEQDSLKKLMYLFNIIKCKSLSFSIYYSLFNTLLDTKLLSSPKLLAEYMMILTYFNINEENSGNFCEIIEKFILIVLQTPEIIMSEIKKTNGEASYKCYICELLILIIFRAASKSSNIINFTLKSFLENPDIQYFQHKRFDSTNRERVLLYTFAMLSMLVYNKEIDFVEIFENFCQKSDIFKHLSQFFKAISEQSVYNTMDNIKLTNELCKEQLNQLQSSNFSGSILSESWVHYIHRVLINEIVVPIEKFLEPPKISELPSRSSSTIQKVDTERSILNLSKYNYFVMKKESLVLAQKEYLLHRKFSIEPILSLNKEFTIKNRIDKSGRCSFLKELKAPLEFDKNSSILLKQSIKRSESFYDFSSILNSDAFRHSVYTRCATEDNFGSLCNSKSFFSCNFEQIKIKGSYFGRLVITSKYIHFKFEGIKKDMSQLDTNPNSALDFTIKSKVSSKVIKVASVSEVLGRKFLHRSTAFEIFLLNGKSYFLNLFFESKLKSAFEVMDKWKSAQVHEKFTLDLISTQQLKWVEGKISNFDYLMLLNKYSGRSYNDLSQYPVFPWILTNFESKSLNLLDPSIYRDLEYPIGAQTKLQQSHLESRLKSVPKGSIEEYHYGSHYSNGGTVLHYLFRLEPFTYQAKILQDGNFDIPNRMFYSMRTSWTSCKSGCGDNKELIPELYSMPQCLQNLNALKVGATVKGNDASEFELPPWATNTQDFIRKHRKALESSIASKDLHKWIDLIFGCKQRGAAAKDKFNLFMKITYDDWVINENLSFLQNNLDAVYEQIYHFGQTPSQLFESPHPKRKILGVEKAIERVMTGSIGQVRTIGNILEKVVKVIASDNLLFVFFESGGELHYYLYIIEDKAVLKRKLCVMRMIKFSEFSSTFGLDLWNSMILSYGYTDGCLRQHSVKGELKVVVKTQVKFISVLYLQSNLLFFEDCNIIVSCNTSPKLVKKYFGHKSSIISISGAESFSILGSMSTEGDILIHDIPSGDILRKLVIHGNALKISEFGILIVIKDKLLQTFSFEGNELWYSKFDFPKKFVINQTGEYVIFEQNSKLWAIDLFEDKKTEIVTSYIIDYTFSICDRYIIMISQDQEKQLRIIG